MPAKPQPTRTFPRRALISAAAALALLASAAQGADDALRERERAAFYWPYAALAANVYQTGGQVDAQLSLLLMSSWLQRELQGQADNAPARQRYLAQLRSIQQRRIEAAQAPAAVPALCDDGTPALLFQGGEQGEEALPCRDDDSLSEAERAPPAPADDRYRDQEPASEQDCEYRGGREPAVPLHRAMRDHGWEPVPELQRQLHPRAWSVFVPGLAIDVWRRPLHGDAGAPATVEYALVFRGTVGSGAWFSNLRAVTAFTPLMWDQYRQARLATAALADQIHKLHQLSDRLFQRPQPTRVQITAVGHSLGGGLARYVFMRQRHINRVVAFNPSPVDGSSSFSPAAVSEEQQRKWGLKDRAGVLQRRLLLPSEHPEAPLMPIYSLHEKGEVLSRIAACHAGPVWGAEGGPQVHCDTVDFSRGSIFNQHNMAQLACKLFLAKDGRLQAPAPPPQPGS